MLEVWPVIAPHAHARIKRRDPNGALALPGIVAVLMAEDVPGQNNVGVARHDEPLFAADEVKFHGHIVALVVGESVAACRAAAALIEVPLKSCVQPDLGGRRGETTNCPNATRSASWSVVESR